MADDLKSGESAALRSMSLNVALSRVTSKENMFVLSIDKKAMNVGQSINLCIGRGNHALPNQSKCNVDGDENKSTILIHTFIQWCNKVNESPENCQPIHDKMLELLAQTKMPTSPPHLNNEKMEEKKLKDFFEVYVKRVNELKKYISQRKLNTYDFNYVFKLLNEIKSDANILDAILKDYKKIKSLRPETLSDLSSKINQLCETLDKALASNNGEMK